MAEPIETPYKGVMRAPMYYLGEHVGAA